MEQEPLLAEHRRRAAVTAAPPSPPSVPHQTHHEDALLSLSKPEGWLVNLLTIQAEPLSTTFISPLRALVSDAPRNPSAVLLRLAFGLLSAAYACFILVAAMMISIMIGVTLVRFWVEDPVSIHRQLHFDYTQPHPVAAVSVADGLKERGIPAGHEARVSLVIVMPESHYNTRVGVFQVTAEAISSTGNIVATSSQPCMLRFRSLPVQLTRAFLMGIPPLMGMRDESQKLVIEILRYKESNHKTEVIIVRLKPRAGTVDLPQIYEAEMIIKTQLPHSRSNDIEQPNEVGKNRRYNFRSSEEFSDDFPHVLTRLRERRRSKLKVVFTDARQSEFIEGSASSPGGGETSEVIEDFGDDFGTSESSECVWWLSGLYFTMVVIPCM